jgi:hypothetical protein
MARHDLDEVVLLSTRVTPPPSAVTAIAQPVPRGFRGHALHARV